MATNGNNDSGGLFGLDAALASQPLSPMTDGGRGNPVRGVERLKELMPGLGDEDRPNAGLGPLMEDDDAKTFRAIDEMVRRQEPLARSRLAQDAHYTYLKMGLSFSTLEKQQNQDVYSQSFPPGYTLRAAAVPNKAADLCHKLTETLLVDSAQPDPKPETDDESAVQAAALAREFLMQDGGEAGTNDRAVFYAQVERATTCAASFVWVWVDPTGGGSIAKQIKAHPQATDANNPLVALDPLTGQELPTTDYVLRYVTADGQFTPNPADAERVWVPRLRVERLGREHVRVFPETKELHDAEAVVVLYFTTVGEAKRRWKSVAEMDDTQLAALCEWSPPRPTVILPASVRARWKATSSEGNPSVNDERILFFYAYFRKSDPTYPMGAEVFISGANGGIILSREPLVAEVEVPSGDGQDVRVRDRRDLDIPLAEIKPLSDATNGDPMGVAVMARIAAAGEAGARLVTSLQAAIDKILHPARFVAATSPLHDDDIEASRGNGQLAMVTSMQDVPRYEDSPDLPGNTMDVVEWTYGQMDSAIGLNKPAQGSDDSREVSGVARRIAVQQSLVAVSRMQHAVNIAWERFWRVKLQLIMKAFSVPQLLRYVGVDGSAKQEWFTGADFARVTGVAVKAGTGTMLPPNEKVNYAIQLRDAGMVDEDTALEIALPGYMSVLGVPDNPHIQRVERQIAAWLEGPTPDFAQQAEAFAASQMPQFDAMGNPIPMPEVPAPWTPFADVLPVDSEPSVAAMRKRRLGNLMATTKFSAQPPEWRQAVILAYQSALQAAMPAPVAGPQSMVPQMQEAAPDAPVAA